MSETESISSPRAEPETTRPAAPATPPMPPAVQPRRRPSIAFFMIAMLTLLVGAFALTAQQFRMSTAREAEFAREIAALKNDVAALSTRADALEKSASEAQSAETQLTDLAMRLGVLEANVARAADRDTLAQLQDRIAGLERASPGEMFRIAAATLARANLARAATEAGPFKPELAALRAAAPDDPALGALDAAADNGVPTRMILAARFPGAARAALDAERNTGADGNFVARFWTSVRRLVSVRRVGDVDGTTPQDRLARAEAASGRGDLESAVMEVRGIGGPAAMPLAPWLRDADARLAVDRAIAELNARIVQTLAAPGSPPP